MKYHVYYLLSPFGENSMPVHGLVQITDRHKKEKYFPAIRRKAYARMEYVRVLSESEVLSFNLLYSPKENLTVTSE